MLNGMRTHEMEDVNAKVSGMWLEEMTAASRHTANTEQKTGDGQNEERNEERLN